MTIETRARPQKNRPALPLVAVVLAGGLVIVVAFQTALALGAPFGEAAMGGSHPGTLPVALRLVSGFAALLWFLAVLLVLAKGGRALIPVPAALSRIGTRVLAGLLGLGALMNFASSSPWERWGWGPFTLIMFGLCLVLARSDSPNRAAE